MIKDPDPGPGVEDKLHSLHYPMVSWGKAGSADRNVRGRSSEAYHIRTPAEAESGDVRDRP